MRVFNIEKEIYLDLDDTLANTSEFIKSIYKLDEFHIHKKSFILKHPFLCFKIWNSIKKNPEFWNKIPLTVDANYLYSKSFEISNNIHILTALPSFFYNKNSIEFFLACEQKKLWVLKNFPKIKPENIHVCFSKEKYLYAKGSHTVLIDDSPSNIESWEKHFGKGILVDKKYNSHIFQLKNYHN